MIGLSNNAMIAGEIFAPFSHILAIACVSFSFLSEIDSATLGANLLHSAVEAINAFGLFELAQSS